MENFFKQLGQFKENSRGKIPSLNQSREFLDNLLGFLFPIMNESVKNHNAGKYFEELESELSTILISMSYQQERAREISGFFMSKLPEVYEKLREDGQAIYQGDPAAKSVEEVIMTYPGFLAIAIYRLSHELYKLEIPFLPRIFTEYAHQKTGIDIHPGAQIGRYFCIDHGTGIVVGETTIIGDHVKIYQGVTVGALSVKKEASFTKRHPTIEDHVTLYAGATILGGETTIGQHSVIGGNSWLIKSVAPYSRVTHNSQITVINKNGGSYENQ